MRLFLKRIITRFETWIHDFATPEHGTETPRISRETTVLFWDLTRPILEHVSGKGSTMKRKRYNDMLSSKLKSLIGNLWLTGAHILPPTPLNSSESGLHPENSSHLARPISIRLIPSKKILGLSIRHWSTGERSSALDAQLKTYSS